MSTPGDTFLLPPPCTAGVQSRPHSGDHAQNATLPVAELAAAGVRRISLGGVLSRAAYSALISAAREMKGHGTFTFVDRAASTAEVSSYMVPKKTQTGTA